MIRRGNLRQERMKGMRKRGIIALIMAVLLLCTVLPAYAADVFAFTERNVTVYEGESIETALRREGAAEAEGELTYTSANRNVALVDQNGVVTGAGKGQTQITASLNTGKRVWKTQLNVRVERHVTKVTLDLRNLSVFRATDDEVAPLIREETMNQVIVVSAGRSIRLNTTVTPDGADRNVIYTSSDNGVARVNGANLQAVQAGECDLTVQSKSEPSVMEVFKILVVQPAKEIRVVSDSREVPAGSTLQLYAEFSPENTSIRRVEWVSKAPNIATVDENGLVTGVRKGQAQIVAKSVDGSGRSGGTYITVTQTAESISLNKTDVTVQTRRNVDLIATVLPRETSDRTVLWSSSDETIATVNNGHVTGVKAGECTITATSRSNPALTASATVHVVQRVTGVKFTTPADTSLDVRTTVQLAWTVEPADATDKTLKFTSSRPGIATVDENGLVTAVKRGATTITASATDGSSARGSVRIIVTQPVEGMSIQYPLYHVQLHGWARIRAMIEPSDANNNGVHWSSADESVVTVKGDKSAASLHGHRKGSTTVTGITDDGGFTSTAEVRVDDYNGAVMIEELYLTDDNRIKLVFRNMSDFIIDRVNFTIYCYDMFGQPMVCNDDGVSTSFDGNYPLELYPNERTEHGRFNFHHFAIADTIGVVEVRITGWVDSEGYRWSIQEDMQPTMSWGRYGVTGFPVGGQ